ncbi:MAG: hypothetical protein LBT00_07830 [Spirochaetaceae bacterium]|nr:hypothetical protein [Spirochaetaceae bacterium]
MRTRRVKQSSARASSVWIASLLRAFAMTPHPPAKTSHPRKPQRQPLSPNLYLFPRSLPPVIASEPLVRAGEAFQDVMPLWFASPCGVRNDGYAMRLAKTPFSIFNYPFSIRPKGAPPLDCFTLAPSQ